MGGDNSPRDASVITPQTGAAKYWYVDPRASSNFNPMEYFDEQGHTEEELKKLRAALERMGVVPQGEQPSL